jgi:hypothetical protein
VDANKGPMVVKHYHAKSSYCLTMLLTLTKVRNRMIIYDFMPS